MVFRKYWAHNSNGEKYGNPQQLGYHPYNVDCPQEIGMPHVDAKWHAPQIVAETTLPRYGQYFRILNIFSIYIYIYINLVGGLEHFVFSHIFVIIIPTD